MRTVQKEWETFVKDVLPADLGSVEMHNLQCAFYAGAYGFRTILRDAFESRLSHGASQGIVAALEQELHEFFLTMANKG